MGRPQRILLDSGTNELEIIEFMLGNQSFAINVAKVREILPLDDSALTPTPSAPPAMRGILRLRDQTFPLFDLAIALHLPPTRGEGASVVLVCEFNREITAFLVKAVRRIHRMSWVDLKALDPFLTRQRAKFTGVFSIDEREVLMLDLEHLAATMMPGMRIEAAPCERTSQASRADGQSLTFPPQPPPTNASAEPTPSSGTLAQKRRLRHVLLAEDSALVRESLAHAFRSAGYLDLQLFADGGAAKRHIAALDRRLQQSGDNLDTAISVLITDIEMPQMDGLALCRWMKTGPRTQRVPVLVFSSLIDEQMERKCDQVGADAYVTKPRVDALLTLVDEHCSRAEAGEYEPKIPLADRRSHAS
ncbi:MAG: chemotaxis protein [Nannocystaceae bacterium]